VSEDKQRPVKVYRQGKVKLSRWEKINNNGHKNVSFSIDKYYKEDNGGDWKSTKVFFKDDLRNLRACLERAEIEAVKVDIPQTESVQVENRPANEEDVPF